MPGEEFTSGPAMEEGKENSAGIWKERIISASL